MFNCTYMHSRHGEATFEIYIMAVVLKFQKYVCVHKINIGCNGTENNRTVSRACEPYTHCLIENPLKIVKVIHDYETFS